MFSLGIDIGYSSIKFAVINNNFEIVDNAYILHKGKIEEPIGLYIEELQMKYGFKKIYGAATGQGSKLIAQKYGLEWINEVTSLVEGSKAYNKSINSIIEIGGQNSKYITNVSEANSNSMIISMNSNCSAGTGSFLEEQTSRLGIKLEDYSRYTEAAGYVPRIAGRCSVFAKTDIIHHQQEGVAVKDILLGLAYALVKNYRANVVKKNPIVKPVLIAGGVAHNEAITKALMEILNLSKEEVVIPKTCGNVAALGAAIIGIKEQLILDLTKIKLITSGDNALFNISEDNVTFSALGSFGIGDSINKHSCKAFGYRGRVSGYLGIDVGSTSTNVVLTDQENKVLAYKYLRTLGDPIEAVRSGLSEISRDMGNNIEILGVGTTGSGRYLAGRFVGADVIIDEITAQAKAAYLLDDEVDTIIEIGGQDSKFIKLEKGLVSDFEMNKICAAGTGSFLEEQAKKLNIPIGEFGSLAMTSDNPIDLGDRCTVFIETNIAAALSRGAKLEDIAAGLSYSIVKNYLNKVVGNKEIGKKVFFQGGVAYNQAVINAFRAISGKRIEIPEFFSVTGAYGAAISAMEEMKDKASIFKGFQLERSGTDQKKEVSQPGKPKKKVRIFEEIEKFYLEGYEKRIDPAKKTIGIPRVLFLHKLFPLFNKFFRELGFNVLLSDSSCEKTVELSQEFAMEETCYPIKLINGHVAQLIENKIDYLFLPSLHTMAHPISTTRQNYGCVYMQAFPKLISKAMELENRGVELLSPELSFEFGKAYLMNTLLKLGEKLGKNKISTALALAKGMKSLKNFEMKVEKLGEETIKGLGRDEKALVIITRAYGIVDPILNMGIPEKLENLGYKVLTLSNLPAHDHDTSLEHPNMYWPFGQHILSGAQIIKQHPNLYAVYITNHGCGPDTVLAHYFKEEMKGKPYLSIEVDEHFSSVGVLTRIEAFVNGLKTEKLNKTEPLELKHYSDIAPHKSVNIKARLEEVENEILLYLPYTYPYSQLMAAYLQRRGYSAEVLPMTTKKTLDLGRKYTLSKEYLSFTALAGDVINKAFDLERENRKYGFIIPTSEGAEVGGQYHRLIRDKLDGEGLQKAEIIAPYIEDFIKAAAEDNEIFLLLLGGDIVALAPKDKREGYLKELIGCIIKNELTISILKNLAKKINKDIKSYQTKLFIIGEIDVLFNSFLNNYALQAVEDRGVYLVYAPLSEYMWFIWSDFLKQAKNKKEVLFQKTLSRYAGYLKAVSEELDDRIFEGDIEDLAARADKYLGLYSGGNGRYRRAKALGDLSYANGIITGSSMYENTNTILSILSNNENNSKIPVLNLTFDGNENEIDKSKVESFIYYVLQGNKKKISVKTEEGTA
ncbi:MAG: CoA activase [Alkaliphilus sp.]|nr:CoA activase [Alkaliphilus sp.]